MKSTNNKLAALLMITIVLVSSFAVFTSFIFNIDQISFRYQEKIETNDAGDMPGFSATSGYTLDPEGGENPHKPLFYIMDSSPVRYIKTISCNEYDGGLWRFTEGYNRHYGGDQVSIGGVEDYSEKIENKINIEPITRFSEGFIPVSTYTTSIDGFDFLTYYPEENIFYNSDGFSHEYDIHTEHYRYREEILNRSESIDDDKYIQLPDSISTRTYDLAEDITEDRSNPFQKVLAIQEYLKSNYEYDSDYERAPADQEPTDWFLFEEEKGVCANFNSAMAVLGRAAGIPTRMVKGYKIEDSNDWRTVHADQAHSWVELGLECGWITFDATPGSDCGNCIYESEQEREETKIELDLPSEAYPGEDFIMDIRLTDIGGNTIADQNLTINIDSIYLDRNENGFNKTVQTLKSDIDHVVDLPYTGRYSIKVSFNGSKYYENSTASEVIDIDHVTFDIRTDKVFLRNIDSNPDTKKVLGSIYYDGEPMNNEDIKIEVIDPEANKTYRGPFSLSSDGQGDFEFDYYMENYSKLGKMRIRYEHLGSGTIKNQTVYFKSPVNIAFHTVQTYDKLKIITNLKNDLGDDISGEDIVIYLNSTETGRVREKFQGLSNEEGIVNTIINDPYEDYFKEPLEIKIVFKSSDSYARTSVKDTYRLEKMTKGPITYIGDIIDDIITQYWYILILIIFGSSITIGLRNMLENKKIKEIIKDTEEPEKDLIDIKITQINENLPYVWIVGEPLDIQIRIGKNTGSDRLEVYIEDHKVIETVPKKRSVYVKHIFQKKGIFTLRSKLSNEQKFEKEIKIEIVDHKKGIQVMYSDLLESLKEKGYDIKDEDTPGNIEALLMDKLGYHDCIREIKRYMEKAKYSYHELDKKDFKIMMENLNELGDILED